MTEFEGGCHCGALRYKLDWPQGATIPARRCTCGFCTRFGGTWTSRPDTRLVIRAGNGVARYRFGTESADFLFCKTCGIVIAATCDIGDKLYAVLNVYTLDRFEDIVFAESDSDFNGEALDQRLARRRDNWIPGVQVIEK